jgi:hypothetical protein
MKPPLAGILSTAATSGHVCYTFMLIVLPRSATVFYTKQPFTLLLAGDWQQCYQ